MKRVASIFLTLIMLVAGVHPVMTMHFCAGDLYSVHLFSMDRQGRSCCEKTADMPSAYAGAKGGCCDFKQVELSTDDFNLEAQHVNPNGVQPLVVCLWPALCSVSGYTEPVDMASVRHVFPPGGLRRLNIDRLAYICIYRI
ncbi:MAG: hypothetical protein LBJ60_03725 [Tannerellaceae bacterium]|jgi:hypothetical protein|nr:hypothetical protein [Tannerellaceae bacterium]